MTPQISSNIIDILMLGSIICLFGYITFRMVRLHIWMRREDKRVDRLIEQIKEAQTRRATVFLEGPKSKLNPDPLKDAILDGPSLEGVDLERDKSPMRPINFDDVIPKLQEISNEREWNKTDDIDAFDADTSKDTSPQPANNTQ
jgi:hypothetical protein